MSDLADLLAMAQNRDPQVRAMVAKSIATIPDPAALSTLVELLGDSDEQVRMVAIASLGESRQEDAVMPLLGLLEDESVEVRCNAIAALARIGSPRCFAPILVRLFDAEDEVRRNASAAVGYLRDPRALEPLLLCLEDSNEWVRANSALSLGQLMLPDPVDRLIALVDSDDTITVRGNAISALGALGVDLAGSDDAEAAQASRDALNCVYVCLTNVSEQLKVRLAAQLALAKGFESIAKRERGFAYSVFALISAIASDADADDDLRSTAIWSIGVMWKICGEDETFLDDLKPAAFEAVCAALDDSYDWCVRYAIEALARIGGDDAKSAIEKYRLTCDEDCYSSLCDQALSLLG